MRRAVVIVVVALGLFAAAPAAAQLKTLHVAIMGQDHQPRVGKHWHYEVRVTDKPTGKPVACQHPRRRRADHHVHQRDDCREADREL